jgi:predicted RNA binding protein YcfA (HicA-like mRNA interferase family)
LEQRLRSQNEFFEKKNRKLQNKIKEIKKRIAELQSDRPTSQSDSMQIKQDPGSQNSFNESTRFHEFLVERYLKNPNLSKLIGMTRTQFNKLLAETRPVFQQTTTTGSHRVYERKDSGKISFKAHLYLT